MSGRPAGDATALPPDRDRRAERRAATRAEILDAAWTLAHEHGLAGISLRDLGAAVGMRAQSLYSYFDAKFAIYDAMFAAGNRELLDRYATADRTDDPIEDLHKGARIFFDFCVEDPARYQLLFQRTIPGFEPSPESYALAEELLATTADALDRAGVPARGLDLWTAVITGMVDQQISNDPGGDRWSDRLDEAIDMVLEHVRAPRGAR